MRGSSDFKSKGVAKLEHSDADRLNGRKPPTAQQAAMMEFGYHRRLLQMNPDESYQSNEALRLTVAHTVNEIKQRAVNDPRIRFVEIPRDRFIEPRFQNFKVPIFGLCFVAEDCDVQMPCAGIIFSAGLGKEIAPCLSVISSLCNAKAHSACKYHKEESVLLLLDILREADCPQLIRMFKRGWRIGT